jgi:hypothetical protein
VIWDTFLLGDEADMLECRLRELEQYPGVRHVLVEAALDHQGNPKPLYYGDNKSLFSQWSDRITHIVSRLPVHAADPWEREHAQRQDISLALERADPDDLVLLCDVDEIPSPAALAARPPGMVALEMRLAMFAVDWVCPQPARIATGALARDLWPNLWWARDNGPRSTFPLVPDAGWHFTWLGGPDAIRRKAGQFCHLELRDMILAANEREELYEKGLTWHGSPSYPPASPTQVMVPAEVDESWPSYIRDGLCPPEWFRPR